jgi:hypothetical protein
MENDETLLSSGLDDILPERSSLDARATGAGVDLDAAQTRRLHEDRVIQHHERRSSMAGSLRGDPKTMSTRELDDLDDILDGLDQRNRERPLIDREIPSLASLAPLRIARKHDLAGETAS